MLGNFSNNNFKLNLFSKLNLRNILKDGLKIFIYISNLKISIPHILFEDLLKSYNFNFVLITKSTLLRCHP